MGFHKDNKLVPILSSLEVGDKLEFKTLNEKNSFVKRIYEIKKKHSQFSSYKFISRRNIFTDGYTLWRTK